MYGMYAHVSIRSSFLTFHFEANFKHKYFSNNLGNTEINLSSFNLHAFPLMLVLFKLNFDKSIESFLLNVLNHLY